METKIRKDLNNMVRSIKLIPVKTRFSEKYVCEVTLYNGVVLKFADDGFSKVLMAANKVGSLDKILKSRKLVEELKTNTTLDIATDEYSGTYVCVMYVVDFDGVERNFRLFMEDAKNDKLALDIYYDNWKKLQKEQPKSQVQTQVK